MALLHFDVPWPEPVHIDSFFAVWNVMFLNVSEGQQRVLEEPKHLGPTSICRTNIFFQLVMTLIDIFSLPLSQRLLRL